MHVLLVYSRCLHETGKKNAQTGRQENKSKDL